jgi:superfamily I DNA/RNA helicase
LFSHLSDSELLNYGVPAEWLPDVRSVDEDTLLDVAEHLPREAAEALLSLATGEKPQVIKPRIATTDPFYHPDSLRRFRLMEDVAELAQALDYPWEKWIIFLHPAQRDLVEKHYNGPARISGSAGTGKTIVALHRAVFLAREHPEARILLATFTDALANALRQKLRFLTASRPRAIEQIEVHAMNDMGRRLYEANFGAPQIASKDLVIQTLEESSRLVKGHKFNLYFLWTEWNQVVDAWQLRTWEAYRDVPRLGRRTRLKEGHRVILWSIFEKVLALLEETNTLTYAGMFTRLASHFEDTAFIPYDFAIVDEAQDLSVSQLRFLALMAAKKPDSLFFTGDLGQRIFQHAFSWKTLGVDIRGRSTTLKVNYRTSHQIRIQADRLLGPELSDMDGNVEKRSSISVFNGPPPEIKSLENQEAEIRTVSRWLLARQAEGIAPHEMAVIVRSPALIARAEAAVRKAGIPFKVLDHKVETSRDHVSLITMHLAKGLEFRSVAVMACDDEFVPLQERIETASEESELEEVYNTERHLLYVACTRARDHLLVTSGGIPSEFLDDLRGK